MGIRIGVLKFYQRKKVALLQWGPTAEFGVWWVLFWGATQNLATKFDLIFFLCVAF
jgi:hypothetical protein